MPNYKIARLSGVHYPTVLASLVDTYPEFLTASYAQQQEWLFNSRILYSNSFSNSLQKLGNEAHELIWDLKPMQTRWADENGIAIDHDTWMIDILLAQLQEIQPDIIYLQGTELCIPGRFPSFGSSTSLATIIKDTLDSVRFIAMFSGYPSDISRLQDVDIVFSCTPAIVGHYKQLGISTILCYHGFDESVINSRPTADAAADYDFTFLGSTQAPSARYWMLSEFLMRTPIRLWVDDSDELNADGGFSLQWKNIKVVVRSSVRRGLISLFSKLDVSTLQMMSNGTHMPSSFKKIANEIVRSLDGPLIKNRETSNLIRKRLPKKTLRQIYPDRCESPVVGNKYFDVLARSRVTFNKHTDKNRAVVGNLRMFEATGVGTCLLTDTGWNMKDLYEPDTEVVTYTSAEEAIEKASYLLENESERASIASAGQKKTLSSHTIFHRCQLIDEVFQSKL